MARHSQPWQDDARLFRAERADMRAGQANGQVMRLLRNLRFRLDEAFVVDVC